MMSEPSHEPSSPSYGTRRVPTTINVYLFLSFTIILMQIFGNMVGWFLRSGVLKWKGAHSNCVKQERIVCDGIIRWRLLWEM